MYVHKWSSNRMQNITGSSEAYSEPCPTSKMELFVKTVHGWQPLIIFAKSSILQVWQGAEYASPRANFHASSFYLNPFFFGETNELRELLSTTNTLYRREQGLLCLQHRLQNIKLIDHGYTGLCSPYFENEATLMGLTASLICNWNLNSCWSPCEMRPFLLFPV